jgi:hypothetical protein
VFLCPGAPRMAIGKTDDAGNYRLTTFDPDDGAIIGTHIVTVRKIAEEADSAAPSSAATAGKPRSKQIEEAMEQAAVRMEKAEKAKPLLPAKYADQRTSDLSKEVVAGDNVINLELTD